MHDCLFQASLKEKKESLEFILLLIEASRDTDPSVIEVQTYTIILVVRRYVTTHVSTQLKTI